MTSLEEQLAIMTKKFNMAKQDRDKFRKENEELKMNTHRLNCSHCNLISSEDDIFLSLDCGEFTCEGCFNEGKSKNIKKENEKLKDKIGDLDWSLLDAITQKDIAIEERQNGYTHHYSQNEELKKENEELEQQIADITDALWDEAVPVPRTDLILSDIHKGRQAIEENQELFQELENMKKKYICPAEYIMDD